MMMPASAGKEVEDGADEKGIAEQAKPSNRRLVFLGRKCET
jgi:hypothetical protein